jgi:hypothetical protein
MTQSTIPIEKIKAAMLAIQDADAALLGMTTWNQSNRTSEAMQAHRKAILELQGIVSAQGATDLKGCASRFAEMAHEVASTFHGQLHGEALKALEQAIDHALHAKTSLIRAEQIHQAYLEGVA